MIARIVTAKMTYSNIDSALQGPITLALKNKLTEFFKVLVFKKKLKLKKNFLIL